MSKVQVYYSPRHAQRVEVRQAANALRFWYRLTGLVLALSLWGSLSIMIAHWLAR